VNGRGCCCADGTGHRAHHGTRGQVHSDAVERRQCGHNRSSRGARGQIHAPGIGHRCALRTAGGVAETGPERRGCPDATWRRVGLRCALADAKPSDGKYHGGRLERLHLHDRLPGSVGRRSQLSAICRCRRSRRSDNSTKHPDVNRRSRFITPPNSCASFQPLPNTDPGLAGETGVSGEAGTVYGLDGLKIGRGIEGTLSSKGPRNPPPMWPPPKRPPPPPPYPAARASVATAIMPTNKAAAATTPR
jgi:hypothetical protein